MTMKTFRQAAFGLLTVACMNTPLQAAESGKLLVWIYADKAYNGVQDVGDWFAEETGVPVMVEHPVDTASKFQQAAAVGKGPDIMIWAHDRAGEWSQSGLLVPVDPAAELVAAIDAKAWDAFRIGGNLWGYPISLESVGLIYNKKYLDQPPASFEEIAELQPKLREAFDITAMMWDYRNTYFSWPFLNANGGYIFAKTDDGYDVSDIGVNHPGAVLGAEYMRSMIEQGITPLGIGYPEMEASFNHGQVAMVIDGPWGWKNMRINDLDFAVAPLPTLNGQPLKPFVGVQGAMISRISPNKDLAKLFIEDYILNIKGLRLINDDKPIGVPALRAFYDELEDDPLIKATLQNVAQGELMPNVPEMGAFWSAMNPALENIMLGRQDAKGALDNAYRRINQVVSEEEE